ncbi:hypothetical protein RHGRI_020843 [Rhododendron griersonianum]|uniref:Uncharacterized protein n=1 Tax=Rhododendron griersonianum TaxID=479676 RepID=A0AAV6JNT4_9ERIC|nr:hypothetical protein RHGRI_020843 [Rhododendron griersonianum]
MKLEDHSVADLEEMLYGTRNRVFDGLRLGIPSDFKKLAKSLDYELELGLKITMLSCTALSIYSREEKNLQRCWTYLEEPSKRDTVMVTSITFKDPACLSITDHALTTEELWSGLHGFSRQSPFCRSSIGPNSDPPVDGEEQGIQPPVQPPAVLGSTARARPFHRAVSQPPMAAGRRLVLVTPASSSSSLVSGLARSGPL